MATSDDMTIDVHHRLNGPFSGTWSMYFKYVCGGVTFRFVVHDAGAHSRESGRRSSQARGASAE